MEQLSIRLFGGLEVQRGRTLVAGFPTQRSALLFAYLVLNRDRLHHRDVLCGLFWGDQGDGAAKKGLRNALWRIRSVIEPQSRERGTHLRVEGSHIGFRSSSDVWVDAWEFEACTGVLAGKSIDDRPWDTETADRMTKAAALYRGDLLEGLYDEWCLSEQGRLRLAYLTLLERLVAFHRSSGRWLEAIGVGRRLLGLDPLREHIHRAVMDCHVAMGDRPSALRQYQACVDALRRELGIEPMAETRRLYERIRWGESAGQQPGRWNGARRKATDTSGLATEVDDALRTLYDLAERLERARLAMAPFQPPSPHGRPIRSTPRMGG